MPSCAVLSLAFALVAATRALPVDDISPRNDIGAVASGVESQVAGGSVSDASTGCKSPLTECASEAFGLLKLGPENAGNADSALSRVSNGKALLNLIGANSTSKIPVGRLSGTGGETPMGSTADGHPALIELDSEGRRGDSSSKNSSGLVE